MPISIPIPLSAGGKSEHVGVAGMAGRSDNIEVVIDFPVIDALGVAVIAHPHPLFGGSLDNKVAQTLSRGLLEHGFIALRPNFRGVGASSGVHDHGVGEIDDLLTVARYAIGRFSATRLILAGFSFGAYVQTQVAARAPAELGLAAERLILVGLATGAVSDARSYSALPVPTDTIVIHGEVDDTIPLANVLDWARPQDLPVTVAPGCDHFFHRKLHIIRAIINNQWRDR